MEVESQYALAKQQYCRNEDVLITSFKSSFFQAVLQSVFFVVELCAYFQLSHWFENKWAKWCFTTVIWNVALCADALVLICWIEFYG